MAVNDPLIPSPYPLPQGERETNYPLPSPLPRWGEGVAPSPALPRTTGEGDVGANGVRPTDPYGEFSGNPGDLNEILVPENRPFFHAAGPTGVLLAHGFSSGPSQMRTFGNFLTSVNITNVGVLLAGHGTTPEQMRYTTWPDWYASVESGYQQLLDYGCQRIFVVGLSLGGTLALHLAANRPLNGMVIINAPIYLPQFVKGAISLLGGAIPYLNKMFSDVRDPVAREQQRGYNRTPVECYTSLIDFLTLVRAELPRITTPALVMYSRNDHVVMTPNSHHIYAQLGSPEKHLIVLHRGYHVATVDYDKGDVFARTHDFIVHHGGLEVKSLTE